MPPPSLSLYGLLFGLVFRMRVSVKGMTVSLSVLCDRTCQRYRHRYRQIFWLQAITCEHPHLQEEFFLSRSKDLMDEGGGARTIANGVWLGN